MFKNNIQIITTGEDEKIKIWSINFVLINEIDTIKVVPL